MRTRRYRFGPCVYDPGSRELRFADARVVVPHQESKVLTALLERAGAVVSKTQLADLLWPNERYGEFDRAIHNLISKLRRLHPEAAQWIETVPKAGYKLRIAVEVEEASAPTANPASVDTTAIVDATANDAIASDATPRIDATATPRIDSAVPVSESVAKPRRSRRRAFAVIAAAGTATAIALWLVLARSSTPAPAATDPTTMVGVLPFTGSGGELGESDALRDQVADALAGIPGAEVRASHSLTRQMSETPEQLQRAAQQLRLHLLIAGTLEVRDQDYALSLELIRADGTHLSSLHYRGHRAGLGALPERVAIDVRPFLRRPTSGEPQHSVGSTPNQTAYDLAFRARAVLSQRGKADVEQAIALYKNAVAVDPNFARAWSGLAESHLVLANFGETGTGAQDFEAARSAANQALVLDPGNAQAHSTLGLLLLQHDCQLEQAEQQLRLAISSNPGFATHHIRMAVLLTDEGRFAEAQREIDLARDSDPDWPVVNGTAMYVHLMARDYEAAIADAEALVRARPDWSRGYQHLGWALWYAGRHAPAVDAWHRAAVLDKDDATAALHLAAGQRLAQHGVRAYAEYRIAARLPSEDDFVSAEWYAFAGDIAHTLDELEKLVATRSPESLKIPWNPAYDFVRTEPRYKQLVADLNRRCGR